MEGFATPFRLRLNAAMPELTRRRSPDSRDECWHVFYGDVHAGTISVRSGNPHDTDPWQWGCGFYPGCHPGVLACFNPQWPNLNLAVAEFGKR